MIYRNKDLNQPRRTPIPPNAPGPLFSPPRRTSGPTPPLEYHHLLLTYK